MNNFWIKFNKTRVEKLSKKLVFYNRENNINAIENNNYNHIRDIYFTLIATESFKKKINVLDYGSNIITISNIKNKINCKRVKFDIYDPNYEKKIYDHMHINYANFIVTNNFKEIVKNKYLILNFGSSIQYDSNILNKIKLFNLRRTKYIIITHSPMSLSKEYSSKQKGKNKLIQHVHSLKEVINFFKVRKFEMIFKSRNDDKYIACTKIKYKTYSLNLIFKNAKKINS